MCEGPPPGPVRVNFNQFTSGLYPPPSVRLDTYWVVSFTKEATEHVDKEIIRGDRQSTHFYYLDSWPWTYDICTIKNTATDAQPYHPLFTSPCY